MKNDVYMALVGRVVFEIPPIKGSRFIAIAEPVVDEISVKQCLEQVILDYPDARHHCWAYQLCSGYTRFSDAGEPSGSAGKPILAPIVGRQLFDAIVIVIRYFGGTKLGVGGLVRAYSQACNAVLDVAGSQQKMLKVLPKTVLKLQYAYADTGQVAAALSALNLIEENAAYSDIVESQIRVEKNKIDAITVLLNEYTAGRIVLHSLSTT